MEEKEIYKKAIEKWGDHAQIIVAIEEMAELQQSLCKHLNNRISSIGEIYEELVDVEIMIKQLKMIYKDKGVFDAYSEIKRQKLDRIRKKLGLHDII